MRLQIAALADYANIAQGNKLNLMGVFDTIHVGNFPTVHPSMVLALRIQLEYEDGDREHTLDVKIEDEDGREIGKASAQAQVPRIAPGTQLTSNQILTFQGIRMRAAGRLIFRIEWNGEEVERVLLTVALVQQQPPQAQ